MLKKTSFLLVLLLTILCLGVMATPYKGKAVILTQYNGSSIDAYFCQEGNNVWYQDKDGYPIVKLGDTYYYATANGNDLVATEYIVGEVDPLFLDLSTYEPVYETKGIENTEYVDILKSTSKEPNEIVQGEITPLVLLCDFKYESPDGNTHGANDFEVYLSEEFYKKFDTYWQTANNIMTENAPLCTSDGKSYRHSAPECIRVDKLTYQWSAKNTLLEDEVFFNKAAIENAIKNNEDKLDRNNDGFIDKIIFVVAGGNSTTEYPTYSGKFCTASDSMASDEVKIGSLYAGYFTQICMDDFSAEFGLPQAIVEEVGFEGIQPITEDTDAVAFFSNMDSDAISTLINNGEWKKASNTVSVLTRDNITLGNITACADTDGYASSDSTDPVTIINETSDKNYGYNIKPANFDKNGDHFIDVIFVVYPSEDGYNYCEVLDKYNGLKSTIFRSSDYRIGKIIRISDANFTAENISNLLLQYTNYKSLSRTENYSHNTYNPAYNIDALGGLSSEYDFLPVNIFEQRQAGYLEKYGTTEEKIGIVEINKNNYFDDENSTYETFTLQKTSNDPSQRYPIAYRITSNSNEYEEFWVEYRTKYSKIGSRELSKEQDEGLYIYRVSTDPDRIGAGNVGAGQLTTKYVADEVYFFRTDGMPDYGITEDLTSLNGDPTKSNIGVYGRKTFSYNTNPAAFYSNGATNAGFKIFNISDPGNNLITFNVSFDSYPPQVVSFTPSNVYLDLDDAYENGTSFCSGYSYGNGVANLGEVGTKFMFGDTVLLNAVYNNGYNTVTLTNCKTTDEKGKTVYKDVTKPICEYNADGSDIIVENDYLKINLSKSYWEYSKDKLFIHYMIYPTDNFYNNVYGKIYFDSNDIKVYLSAKTFDGYEAVDAAGNTLIEKGVFGYTKDEPIIKVVSATPINESSKGYFIENQTINGSYTLGADKIETLGITYKYPSNDTSISLNYIPRIIPLDDPKEENEDLTYITTKIVVSGNEISVPVLVRASGLFGAYAKGDYYSSSCIALKDYSCEVEYDGDDDHQIESSTLSADKAKAAVVNYVKDNPTFLYETLCEAITNETGVTNIINWKDGQQLGHEDLVINDFVSVASKSFSYNLNGNNLSVSFDVTFDEEKTPIKFGEDADNNITLEEYGVASLENNFTTIITKPDENTDYKYLGYYGLGYGVEEFKPVINDVTVKTKDAVEPTYNPVIGSYICDLDKNYYFTVNFNLGKSELTEKEYNKYKASDISFKLVDSSSNNQLYMKYNALANIINVYDTTNSEWVTFEFNSNRNISLGEFTIPCDSFKALTETNSEGTYEFSFVARSKATFADNPLYIETQVVNASGFVSEVFSPEDDYGQNTYMFKSQHNDLPVVNSIVPNEGSINTREATDFVITASDNNGYNDINKIAFDLSYGGVSECLVVYDNQNNRIKLLTENGFTKEAILGTDNEISNKNFTIDCSKSYLAAVGDFKVQLHLSIIPNAAFSGNSLSVLGAALDISVNEDNFTYSKFGYISIETDDPNAITLTSKKITIDVNQTKGLAVINSNGESLSATWSTKDADIAVVDSNGVVKGISEGSTNIIASINNINLTCKVNVEIPDIEYNKPVNTNDIYVSTEAKGSYGIGNSFVPNNTKTSEDFKDNNNTIKSSNNSSKTKTSKVANSNISSSNDVKNNFAGLGGSIKSKDRGHKSSSSSKSSKGYTPSISTIGNGPSFDENSVAVKLSLSNVTVEKGGIVNLRGINGYNNVDKALVWYSSNRKVATVEGGVVNAKSIGSVTIYAKNSLGKVLSCKVRIIKPQLGKNVDLTTGKSFKINYINANNWKTTNPDVVSVNERGVIKALKEGIAEVLCSANGKTIKSTINVK